MRPFTPKKTKFGNVKTRGYDSKREADYAHELMLRKLATNGDVLDWLEQVKIKLTADTAYIVDFLVFKRDGSTELVEIKGAETATWRLKMKLMAEHRPALFKKLIVLE